MTRLIVLIHLCFISAASHGQDFDRSIFIRLAGSLVKIEALAGDGTLSFGTGVAIAPGRVATNCHVTRNAANITMLRGGIRWRVAGQMADVAHDLCLLHAPRLDATPAPLGKVSALKLGQQVGAIGFERGVNIQFRPGRVTALHRLDGSSVLRSSTPFTSGASGGGLFDTAGQLVGLLTFRQRGTDGSYFSIPIDWLSARIGDNALYVPIAPLDAKLKAFWQHSVDSLPYFMQANSLAVDQKWVPLLQLTNRWGNAEKTSPEPWIAQGGAYDGLNRPENAVKAFEEALKRNPDSSEAWFALGRIYAKQGSDERFQLIRQNLVRLNPDLAADLAKELPARPPRSNQLKSEL
jgi:serine protease Do